MGKVVISASKSINTRQCVNASASSQKNSTREKIRASNVVGGAAGLLVWPSLAPLLSLSFNIHYFGRLIFLGCPLPSAESHDQS